MDWSVKIVPAANPTPTAPAAFQPDLMGSKPGDPLKVLDDDLVTWNNTTAQEHWPWQTDANYAPVPENPTTHDPQDPTPYWIISSRRADELAAAIAGAAD